MYIFLCFIKILLATAIFVLVLLEQQTTCRKCVHRCVSLSRVSSIIWTYSTYFNSLLTVVFLLKASRLPLTIGISFGALVLCAVVMVVVLYKKRQRRVQRTQETDGNYSCWHKIADVRRINLLILSSGQMMLFISLDLYSAGFGRFGEFRASIW